MSDIDLEKGPQLSMRDISVPLRPDSPALPEFTFSEEVNVPLPSPTWRRIPPELWRWVVSSYLEPRPHPKYENMNYGNTVIQSND
jgi:hypothetical protein